MSAGTQQLLRPARLYTWSELAANQQLLLARSGVYAWFFDAVPRHVPTAECRTHAGGTLLYIGIAPKAPPKNGKPPSKASLRSRIRNHFRGTADGSTLRLTLGCLLAPELDLSLRRVGSGSRMTFTHEGEARLSAWMAANARVCWVEHSTPWALEAELIATLALPLNLDQNARHVFHATLSNIRALAKAEARSKPRVPR